MLIDTKQRFYELAEQGRVGNTPKTWGSAFEWVSSGEFEKLRNFGIRSKSVSNPLCFPGLDRYDVLPTLVENRIEEGSYVITAAPPCQNEPFHCLQGELMYKDNIFYLYYTHKWGYMRKMLADHGRHAYGAKVTSLLSRFCDFESKKMLYELLGTYCMPGRDLTIEFTVFPQEVPKIGRMEKLNTLIWEARHY